MVLAFTKTSSLL